MPSSRYHHIHIPDPSVPSEVSFNGRLPRCAKCQEPVELIISTHDAANRCMKFEVHCHGAETTFTVTERDIHSGQLFLGDIEFPLTIEYQQ